MSMRSGFRERWMVLASGHGVLAWACWGWRLGEWLDYLPQLGQPSLRFNGSLSHRSAQAGLAPAHPTRFLQLHVVCRSKCNTACQRTSRGHGLPSTAQFHMPADARFTVQRFLPSLGCNAHMLPGFTNARTSLPSPAHVIASVAMA